MKKSTNKKSITTKLTSKMMLFLVAMLIAVAVPLQMFQKVSADQYDDKIAALQQDINNFNAQVAQLAAQANTLQSAIASLQAQAAIIQDQININQAKYDQLVIQIADTEQKIKDNQNALGKTIATMYVADQITTLEMLASSKNIGDYLDKQEYRSSVRNQLTSTIAKIKDLKTQLDKQQADVKAVLDKQNGEKAGLAATQAQQQEILNQTQGQEVAYQQLVTNNQQKVAELNAQQRAYYQSLLNSGRSVNSGTYGSFQYKNWSGNQGCSGGYPSSIPGLWGYYGCAYGLDQGVDSWALYNRECVSYVAWSLQNRGKHVISFSGRGNASDWPSSAVLYSGASIVTDPQSDDAVILGYIPGFTSTAGHVMIINSISDDGWLNVSQFNFWGTGEYSTMSIKFDINDPAVAVLRFQNN